MTAEALLPLMMLDNELIITHGNGPVVGKILMRQMLTRDTIAPMPLDICVAHSQGGIAYLLMQAMENALRDQGNQRHVTCLLTQVEVDPDDPAFENPSKPIGPFFDEEEAKKIGAELSWLMKEDLGAVGVMLCLHPSPNTFAIYRWYKFWLGAALSSSPVAVVAFRLCGIPMGCEKVSRPLSIRI